MARGKDGDQEISPRVYSYIRFSTPEQAMGDSERRQLEIVREWAEKRGYKLDESLKPDRGVSGFTGEHRKKGHLGTFLKMVQAGSVPKGSILVVENIDRLSREGVFTTLREIFFTLFDYGVTIQTLSPEQAFDRKTVETGEAFLLIAQIIRARDESERKSQRGQQNWKQKKKRAHDDGCILTAKCPAWLRVVTDSKDGQRRFQILPGAKQTIRKMFDLKLSGVGVRGMVKPLNASAKWSRPNGFHASYIRKILVNRAVIGEHQPCKNVDGTFVPDGDPIQDYFPKIVDPAVFLAVQAMFAKNKYKGGRTGKAKNLFTHFVKCAYCGGSMAYVDRSRAKRSYPYLVCDRARRGVGCARHAVRYDECERLVLENCHRLQPDCVLPNPTEQSNQCMVLRREIDGWNEELKRLEEQIDNLVDQVTQTRSREMRDRYEQRIERLFEQKTNATAELTSATDKLLDAEKGLESVTRWKQGLSALIKALDADDPEIRLRLRMHLRDLIAKIEVFPVGHAKEYDPDAAPQPKKEGSTTVRRRTSKREGDDIAEYLSAVIDKPQKGFGDFIQYVVKRRMSKEGRFLRIHFKTGATLNLVPPGSLASGMELQKKTDKSNWHLVAPSIQRLWQDFEATHRKKTKSVTSALRSARTSE